MGRTVGALDQQGRKVERRVAFYADAESVERLVVGDLRGGEPRKVGAASGIANIAVTAACGMPTTSRRWSSIAATASPASRAARARFPASPAIGEVVASGGSYSAIAANDAGEASAASSAPTAPEECPTSSGSNEPGGNGEHVGCVGGHRVRRPDRRYRARRGGAARARPGTRLSADGRHLPGRARRCCPG